MSVAGRLLRAIVRRRGAIVTPLTRGWQRELRLIAETRKRTDLLLTDAAAVHLLACARAASALPGAFAEAGVFKGGSARLICEEKGDAPLHLFDVFELLQAAGVPGAEQVRNHFGSVHGKLAEAQRLLAPYPKVHFHPGLFPGTTRDLGNLRFSFVHLDLDLAEPTRAALDYFSPRMLPGGIMIADDYADEALRECFASWFASKLDTLIEMPWAQLMVVARGS
jgi:O-methyltransferase